jgi:hypothetical protein
VQAVKRTSRLIRPGSNADDKLQLWKTTTKYVTAFFGIGLFSLIPLSWPEWEGAAVTGLLVAICFGILTAYQTVQTFREESLRIQQLVPAEKQKKLTAEAKNFKIGLLYFLLGPFYIFMGINNGKITGFPARTQEEWLSMIWFWLAPLLIFTCLAKGWFLYELKHGHPLFVSERPT